MKEDIKKILLMGLGAMSLTNEKAKEIKDDLLKKGQELYEKGAIANEELKHNIKEVMKDNKKTDIKEKPSKKKNKEGKPKKEKKSLFGWLLGKK